MERKAIALFSGGLDSALAAYLVKRQGIDVEGIHFTSFFSNTDPERPDSPVRITAECIGIPIRFVAKGEDFIDIIRNPRHGYGKNINPCIDCRVYTLKKARELLPEMGASFIVTGEVVGQRPMSQRRDTMRMIEKEAGCDGIVVRPLSGKILPPTKPEQAGLLDREQFPDIAGRGRKTQLALAREIELQGFQAPAGGCLLTDKAFAVRVRDLLEDREDAAIQDFQLLGVGRHVRIRPGLKAVVGRHEAENAVIEKFRDRGTLFLPVDFPGPVVLAHGEPDETEERLIGGIVLRYSKASARGEWIDVLPPCGPSHRIHVLEPTEDSWISDRLL